MKRNLYRMFDRTAKLWCTERVRRRAEAERTDGIQSTATESATEVDRFLVGDVFIDIGAHVVNLRSD